MHVLTRCEENPWLQTSTESNSHSVHNGRVTEREYFPWVTSRSWHGLFFCPTISWRQMATGMLWNLITCTYIAMLIGLFAHRFVSEILYVAVFANSFECVTPRVPRRHSLTFVIGRATFEQRKFNRHWLLKLVIIPYMSVDFLIRISVRCNELCRTRA